MKLKFKSDNFLKNIISSLVTKIKSKSSVFNPSNPFNILPAILPIGRIHFVGL